MNSLLSAMTLTQIIVISVVCVIAAASIVYGAIRKFVKMAWTSWQLLIIFACTLLLPVMKFLPSEGTAGFVVTAVYLFVVTAIVLVIGWAVRRYMMKKVTRSNMFFRFCNRFLGAVTGVLNWAMLALVLGGFALSATYHTASIEALNGVYSIPFIKDFVLKYALDLFIVALCILFVRGGYRIGLARSIQTVIMLALTLGAILLSLYLTMRWSFLQKITSAIANSIAGRGMNAIAATGIAYLITSIICFVVFFIVIVLLGLLLNIAVKKFRSIKVVGAIDGAILSVVFFGFFIALVCVTNMGVNAIAGGALDKLIANVSAGAGEGTSAMTTVAQGVAEFFTSSPLGALFYYLNPLNYLFGF